MYARDYRRYAWNVLTGHWGYAILAYVLYSVLYIASASLAGLGPLVVYGPLMVGMSGMYMGLVRRHELSVERFFDGFTCGFVDNFLAGLLVGLFTFLWSLLFIIPGIVKSFSYAMTPFIMAENPNMTANESITASRQMMDGHKGELFWLELTFIGWSLLCIFTLGIGNLFLNPYTNAAQASFYRNLCPRRTYIE